MIKEKAKITYRCGLEPDAMSLEELCRRAGISLTVGYELANRNALPIPTMRFGRQFRFSRRAWDALMDAQHELAVSTDAA